MVWRGRARQLGSGRMRTAGCIALGRACGSVRVWAWRRQWARGAALGPLGTRAGRWLSPAVRAWALQYRGGGLCGSTDSTITVLQSNLSYNSATVRALASNT